MVNGSDGSTPVRGGDGGDDDTDATTKMGMEMPDGGVEAAADASTPYDPCEGSGLHLDCTFGDGGLLFLDPPLVDAGSADATADASDDLDAGNDADADDAASVTPLPLYRNVPSVAVAPNGLVEVVASASTVGQDNPDGFLYTIDPTDAATTQSILPGLGLTLDARVFGTQPLVVISLSSGDAKVSIIADGSVVSSAENTQVYGNAFVTLTVQELLSFDGTSVRAFVVLNATPINIFTGSTSTFPAICTFLPSPQGDVPNGTYNGYPLDGSTNSPSAATDVDGGTWIVEQNNAGSASAAVQAAFLPADDASVTFQACPYLPSAADVVSTTAGTVAVGIGDHGVTFVTLQSDTGACSLLTNLTTPVLGGSSANAVYLSAEDSGFSALFESTGGLAVARFSSSGTLDLSVGVGGYVTTTLPESSVAGRPARFGNALYVPVAIGNPITRVGVVRFVAPP